MKRIVEVTDAVGLEAMLGERVLLMCANYFYVGKLTGVNKTFVELQDASIVYETGEWTAETYARAERLGIEPHYVRIPAIESWRRGK